MMYVTCDMIYVANYMFTYGKQNTLGAKKWHGQEKQ